MKQKVLLVTAVIFGLLAMYLTHEYLKNERNKLRARTKRVHLIKMNTSLTEGETITQSDVTEFVTERFANDKGDDIRWGNVRKDAILRKLKHSIRSGAILRYSDLQSEKIKGRDGLAGVLKLGQRAISISVDSTSSVTTLVKPGDYVDIVGTFRFPEMKGDRSMDVITMTILQNVYILATGKELAITQRYSANRKRKGYSTVTLSLTPKEVEMIIFATQKGRLTLSLRSYKETGFEKDLQSVNFRYIEENIPKYNKERENKQRSLRY